MTRYDPRVSEKHHELRERLTRGYDALTYGDQRRLVERLVENGVSCAQWTAVLRHHPRALESALAMLLDQPPFVSFDSYLVRRSRGRETSFAEILATGDWADQLGLNVCSSERPGPERYEQIRRAVHHIWARLREEDRDLALGSPELEGSDDPERDQGDERGLRIPAVPIAAFALPTASATMRLALACREPRRYGVRDWGSRLLEDLPAYATFWEAETFAPAIRIGMFGLAEVDDLSPEAVAAALPASAQSAGLVELLYAIELYPRLLSWVGFDPGGGPRSRSVDLWLMGMRLSHTRDGIPVCRVATDPLFGAPSLVWGHTRDRSLERGETALVPYVIPLESINPKELDLVRPRR